MYLGYWWIKVNEISAMAAGTAYKEYDMMATTRTSSPNWEEKITLMCMMQLHKQKDDSWFDGVQNGYRRDTWTYTKIYDAQNKNGNPGYYQCLIYHSVASGSYNQGYYYSHTDRSDCGY